MTRGNSSIAAAIFGREVGTRTRFARHLVVGGIGTAGYISLVAAFVEIVGFDPVLSNALAYGLLIVCQYAGQRAWVYNPQRGHRYSIPRYVVAVFSMLIMTSFAMHIIVDIMGLWYIWGVVILTLIVPPTNFIINFYWIYR